MANKKIKHTLITLFIILWTLVFHYESVRYFYLNPLFQKPLPKVKFLFPPAGWIMFFNVDDSSGYAEVYGVKGGQPQLIDPHDIFRTRTIMFDNIRRNILGGVLSRQRAPAFCQYLKYRFPYFDEFLVAQVYYPSITEDHYRREQALAYRCQ